MDARGGRGTRMATSLGLIGLGQVGIRLARNLVKHGFPLTVHDVNAEAVARAVALGACAAGSPREVATAAEVVLLSLPHPRISEQVLFGDEGAAAAAAPGTIFVELSTTSPTWVRRVAERLAARGASLVDAGVAGGVERVEAGTMVVMAGADPDVFARVLPVFRAVAGEIFHVGPVGTGMIVKVANNAISHVTMVAICEAVAMAVKAGVDPETLHRVITHGSANSDVFQRRYGRRILDGDYANGMSVDLAYKDSELACDLGRELGIPMFVTGVAHAVYEWARASGLGDQDYAALIRLWEQVLGITVSGARKARETRG